MNDHKFMKVSAWVEREFSEGSRPQNRTIREWIETGSIVGVLVGGKSRKLAYVRCDQTVAAINEIDNAVNELIQLSA